MYTYMEELKKYINIETNKSLNQLVYDGIRKAIIKGIIPVGERINEKVYSEYLNISRTPIRNSIEKLKYEGLVEYTPHYGVVVKLVTVKDALEIYKIRITMDTLAALTAMDQMTDSDFNEMWELLERTEYSNNQGNVDEVISFFSDFNFMIYNYAKMPRLKIIVESLYEYLARFRNISLYDNNRRKKSLEEHKMIYRGLKTRDAALVSMIIDEHLNYSKGFIIKEIIKSEKKREDILNGIYR